MVVQLAQEHGRNYRGYLSLSGSTSPQRLRSCYKGLKCKKYAPNQCKPRNPTPLQLLSDHASAHDLKSPKQYLYQLRTLDGRESTTESNC